MDRQNSILGEGEEERGRERGVGEGMWEVERGGRRGGGIWEGGGTWEKREGRGMIHRRRWTTTNRYLVTNKAICSCLWFEVPDHQRGVHGSSSCRQSQSSRTPSDFSLSSLPSCFILGLKETHVTASL